MASIKKYTTAKGTAWRVQYRSPDGKSRTKRGFRTKNEAQSWADKNSVSMLTQEWIEPAAAQTKVSELVQLWLQISEHKPSWRARIDKVWEVHVKPKWGARKVSTITQTEVRAWLASLEYTPRASKANPTPQPRPLSGSSKRHCLTVLAGALDIAVQEKMIHSNPARGFPLPKKAKAHKVFLSAGQLAALAGESSNPDLILVLGVTGMRWGEMAGLQVQDVDVAGQRIHVRRNAVWVDGKTVVGTPKSGEARSIVMPLFVVEIFKRHLSGKARGEWVFSDSGEPLHRPYSPNHWFQQAVARSVEKGLIPQRVTLHDLRHSAASIMVSSGANIKAVQRQLGHASAAMTLDVYAELFDDDLSGLGAALDEVFSDVVKLSSDRGENGGLRRLNAV